MKIKDRFNKNYMQISLYVIITVLIIYALSLVLKNAPAIINTTIQKLQLIYSVIRPVIFGFIFAYIMSPPVDFFERRYQRIREIKLFRRLVVPRIWAAITAVLVVFLIIIGLISLMVFTVTDQLRLANFDDISALAQLYLNNLEGFYNSIVDKLGNLDIQSKEFSEYIKSVTNEIADVLMNFATNTLNSIKNVSSNLTTAIFSFIIGFYFLIDGKLFIGYLKKVFKAIFNENVNKYVRRMMQDLDEVFSGYIRGQLTDALVMMIMISIALSLAGVKFAIIIGVFAGLGNLIPYVGPFIAYISTTAVCLLNGEVKTWVVAMIVLFIIQFIDGNMIGPKLLSNSIKIHPLIVIVSLIIGSAMGGFAGMLLAVPFGAYLKLIFVRFINYRLEYKMKNNKA